MTKVVARSLLFHRPIEPAMKPLPLMVSVSPVDPVVPEVGLKLPITGRGLDELTGKLTTFELPPPGIGLITITARVPAAAISEAGICVDNWVELMNVVIRLVLLILITEAGTNPVPLTVNWKAGPPGIAECGSRLTITGAG